MTSITTIRKITLAVFSALAILMAPHAALAAKVEICHKGKKTLRVSERAIAGHRAHGDYLGKCEDVHAARLLLSCAVGEVAPATHEVIAVSGSDDLTADLGVEELALLDCANALQAVEATDCKLEHVFGTPEAQTYSFSCPTENSMIRDDDEDGTS